jgi:phage baseplate assembly protein V
MNLDGMVRLITRVMAPTISRVNGMVTRGVIRRVADDARQQLVQLSLLADEVADDVEHLQPFGVSFVPPNGAEVAAIAVGGNQDYLLALGATSREHRPTGAAEGEGGLYTLTGWKVFLDDEGTVYIGGDAATATVRVARADLVEAELGKVRDALAAALAPPSGGALTYAPPSAEYTAVGSVGSSKAWVVE